MPESEFEPDFPSEYRFCRLTFAEQQVMLDDDEPSRYLMHWNGTIGWHHPMGERVDPIGAFSLYLVDGDSAMDERADIFNVYDTEQGIFDVYQGLFDTKTGNLKDRVERIAFGNDFAMSANVLIFDRLVIYPAHRGHGVGLLALRALMHHFRSFAGLMVMKPYPLQFEGSTHKELVGLGREHWALDSYKLKQAGATAKLRRHYACLGFAQVPRTDFMVRNPLVPLPGVEVLLGTATE